MVTLEILYNSTIYQYITSHILTNKTLQPFKDKRDGLCTSMVSYMTNFFFVINVKWRYLSIIMFKHRGEEGL